MYTKVKTIEDGLRLLGIDPEKNKLENQIRNDVIVWGGAVVYITDSQTLVLDNDQLEGLVKHRKANSFSFDLFPTVSKKIAKLLHSVAVGHRTKDGYDFQSCDELPEILEALNEYEAVTGESLGSDPRNTSIGVAASPTYPLRGVGKDLGKELLSIIGQFRPENKAEEGDLIKSLLSLRDKFKLGELANAREAN